MTEGVGVVELKKMKLNLPDGGLRLAYGGVLKEIEGAYEECGAPLGDSNAIYICHALTGDAHVAGIRPGEKLHEEMITATDSLSTIDLGKYYAILPSVAFNYTTQDYLDHYPGARFVEPGFHYSSDNNQDWETVETLREKFRQVIPGFEVRSH